MLTEIAFLFVTKMGCTLIASDSEIKIDLKLWLWNSQICILKALSWEEKNTLIAKLRMGWEKPECL